MTQSTDNTRGRTAVGTRLGSAVVDLDEDGRAYTATRAFAASPERLFRAFTVPEDLRVWFPAAAPEGSELQRCDSDPVVGGRYHYELVIPEHGLMQWFGTYTRIDHPDRLDAEEWFVMGEGEPAGEPSRQTLTFERVDDDLTRLTMRVHLPTPADPEQFRRQSAVGLSASLDAMDRLVAG